MKKNFGNTKKRSPMLHSVKTVREFARLNRRRLSNLDNIELVYSGPVDYGSNPVAQPSKPQKGTGASIGMSCKNEVAQPSNTQILQDIIGCFKTVKKKKLRSKRIIALLCADEKKPWATFCNGRHLNYRGLSKLLKGFEIHSKDLRFKVKGKSKVFKGYRIRSFMNAYRKHK